MLNVKDFLNNNASVLKDICISVLAELSTGTSNIVFTQNYADARIYEIASRLINMGIPREEKIVSAVVKTLKSSLIKDAAYVSAKNRLPLRTDSANNLTMPLITAKEARKLYDENKASLDCIVEHTISQYSNTEDYVFMRDIAEHSAVETIMYHTEPPVEAVKTYLQMELELEFAYLRSQGNTKVAAL